MNEIEVYSDRNGGPQVSEKKEKKEPEKILKDGIEIHADSWQRTLWGVIYSIVGLVGSYLIFEATYWLVSNFDINYYWVSLIAVVFSFMAIQVYNKATGDMPSLLRTPIIFFTIIIFVLSLLIGYHHSEGKSAGHLDNFLWTTSAYDNRTNFSDDVTSITDNDSKKSETIYLSSPQMFLTAEKVYSAGDVVSFKVSGGSVKIVCGNTFGHGEHQIKIKNDGRLTFHTTSNSAATVEIH